VKNTGTRRPSRRRSGVGRRAPGAPQSVLVLHLDADRLRRDGLHLGEVAHLAGALSALAFDAPVVIENTTSAGHLHQTLAGLVLAKMTFDIVVVVAHSNVDGIRVASDLFITWDAFAGYLKPFKPRRLLLVACKAGRWEAGEALFRSIPRLRRIFACPGNASKHFGALMLCAMPYVVAERRPRTQHVYWSQVASISMTGTQLREWRRTTDRGNRDSAVLDLVADLTDPVVRQVPSALVSAATAVLRATQGRLATSTSRAPEPGG
jgi:hypothetical protein